MAKSPKEEGSLNEHEPLPEGDLGIQGVIYCKKCGRALWTKLAGDQPHKSKPCKPGPITFKFI